MTPPSTGAPRGASWRRIRAAVISVALAAVVTVVVTVTPVVAALPATAASPTPSPTPDVVTPSLVVSPVSGGLVRTGQPLSISTRVENPGETTLPAATATVQLGTAPLSTSAEIDAWLDDGEASGGWDTVDRPVFAPIEPESEQGTTTTVPVETLATRVPGVYPLEVTYGTLEDRAVVTLQDAAADQRSVGVGVVVAVTAGPQTVGLLTADALAELTSETGRLTRILDGVAGTGAVLAVDPAVLASIRVLGTEAPASATAWLDRLDALSNEKFALQFGDADVTVQVDAGLTELLAPTTLTYAVAASEETADAENETDAGGATPSAGPTPSASPTGQPTTPPTPRPTPTDLDYLLNVSGARENVYWPAQGVASTTVVETLRDWSVRDGSDSGDTDSGDTAEPDGGFLTLVAAPSAAQAAGTAGTARVAAYDARTGAAVRAVTAAEDFDRAAALAELTARLWLTTSTATGTVLVVSDRLADVSEHGLTAALDAVRSLPGTQPATLSEIVSAPASALTLHDTEDPARVAALRELQAGADRITAFATVLDDPTQLTGRERTAILQLIGAAWAGDDEWPAALAAHAEATATTLASVSIRPLSDIQLLGYSAPLSVWVENALPWPANLVLTAAPDDLRLDIERVTPVTAAPQVNTRVQVPINARVGSGEVSIELRLFSTTYQPIGPTRHADVNVRAEWELYGIVILSVLVGGLLLAGIIRTILRRRRGRREDAGADEDPDGDGHRDDSGDLAVDPERPGEDRG